MSLQCLVFDCDGVILDSVPVKTRAFARIAAPHGQEAQDRFVMYHTRHGGVSRYKKFQWFYNEVLGREISDEESERLGRLFAEYALDEVRIALEERAAMSPDALTGLEANLRFAQNENMFTRIFGRLSAWQNWIFNRPNAVGDKGALKLYGTGQKAGFDFNRV